MPRDSLISFGVCFGKFTKSRKFVLKITCLDYLAEHAKVGVVGWGSGTARGPVLQWWLAGVVGLDGAHVGIPSNWLGLPTPQTHSSTLHP